VLIHLAFLSFRTHVLNDSACIGYATLLYCCVLLINNDDDDDDEIGNKLAKFHGHIDHE